MFLEETEEINDAPETEETPTEGTPEEEEVDEEEE